MAISIHSANAGDADFLAWVMLSASRAHLSRGVWDLIIGGDEAGCLEYLKRLAIAEPCSPYHYRSFLLAELDGQPGAALCGFEMLADRWAIAAEAMSNVQRDLGWKESDLAMSRQRVAPVWNCFFEDIGADWGIENVATRPEFRGRGLTTALLDQSLSEAVTRGCRRAQITTYIGNRPAQSVYERSGFKVLDEKRCPALASVLDAPGFMRLIRELP